MRISISTIYLVESGGTSVPYMEMVFMMSTSSQECQDVPRRAKILQYARELILIILVILVIFNLTTRRKSRAIKKGNASIQHCTRPCDYSRYSMACWPL